MVGGRVGGLVTAGRLDALGSEYIRVVNLIVPFVKGILRDLRRCDFGVNPEEPGRCHNDSGLVAMMLQSQILGVTLPTTSVVFIAMASHYKV